jgi:hypothetical protein
MATVADHRTDLIRPNPAMRAIHRNAFGVGGIARLGRAAGNRRTALPQLREFRTGGREAEISRLRARDGRRAMTAHRDRERCRRRPTRVHPGGPGAGGPRVPRGAGFAGLGAPATAAGGTQCGAQGRARAGRRRAPMRKTALAVGADLVRCVAPAPPRARAARGLRRRRWRRASPNASSSEISLYGSR